MAAPLTPEEIETIKRMHAEGASLRATARALGRPHTTISRAAREMGLTWDRATQTAAATAAAAADNRARRHRVIDRLYGQIEAILDRLEAPTYTYVATTVNGIETITLNEPPAHEVKALMQALGSAATTAAKLEAVDSDYDAEGARSMLAGLVNGLRAVAGHLGDTTGDQAAPEHDALDPIDEGGGDAEP